MYPTSPRDCAFGRGVCQRAESHPRAKELRQCLEGGDAACDMDEDEAIEGVRRDALYPEEVINAKLGGS